MPSSHDSCPPPSALGTLVPHFFWSKWVPAGCTCSTVGQAKKGLIYGVLKVLRQSFEKDQLAKQVEQSFLPQSHRRWPWLSVMVLSVVKRNVLDEE